MIGRRLITIITLLSLSSLAWGQMYKVKKGKGKERRYFLQKDYYVVIPALADKELVVSDKKMAIKKRKKRKGPGKIKLFKRPKYIKGTKAVAITRVPGESPVFSDHPKGHGQLRALPGGIFITFQPGTSLEDKENFIQENNLVLKAKMLKDESIWQVESESGAKTLEKINSIQWNEHIKDISPNWWAQFKTK